MKLQFDKNQQYQLDAIAAVIDLFEGQDLNTSDFEFSLSDHATGSLQFTEAGVGNRLTIAPEQILTNLHKIVTNCHESPKVSHLKFQARRTRSSRNAVPAYQNHQKTPTFTRFFADRTVSGEKSHAAAPRWARLLK